MNNWLLTSTRYSWNMTRGFRLVQSTVFVLLFGFIETNSARGFLHIYFVVLSYFVFIYNFIWVFSLFCFYYDVDFINNSMECSNKFSQLLVSINRCLPFIFYLLFEIVSFFPKLVFFYDESFMSIITYFVNSSYLFIISACKIR